MAKFVPFKLKKTISAHSNDVRAVLALKNGSVVSASRDGAAILTSADGTQTHLHPGGGAYLNSLATDKSNKYVYFGSYDSTITCTDMETQEQLLFLGHTANVSCLDAEGTPPILASGSWDHTVRIWENAENSTELKGHTQNVWDVKFTSQPLQVLSASADKTINLWDFGEKKVLRTFKGHTDAVRALHVLNDTTFASASNDQTIRIWNLETGEQLHTLQGHTSFIYSLTGTTNYLISCGEDRTVRIWDKQNFQLLQTIVLPSISQWSVSASTASSDFAVGSSDNTARVFTQSEQTAPAEELAQFEQAIKDSAIGENEIDESEIKDASVLQCPGTQEGQVVIVRNAQTKALEAHQYSGDEWSNIGNVVGSNQATSSKKQTLNGKQYDYVFDVDIKDGAPPLKLPFNNGDNPYLVAEKFITDNSLPPSYVQQIVQFLIQNSQAKQFGQSAARTESPVPPETTNQTAAHTPSGDIPGVLRYNTLLSLKAFQTAPLLNALQKIADERGDNLAPYSIESLLNSLPSAGNDLLKVAFELKNKWRDNLSHLLPVFDLLRIAIGNASTLPSQKVWINLLDALVPELPKHCLLAIRGVVNLVGRSDFDPTNAANKVMLEQAISMTETAVPQLSATKPLAVALATLSLNLAILNPPQLPLTNLIRVTASKVQEFNDSEAVYRLLLAVGLRSVNSAEASQYKKSWFAQAPREDRIQKLLDAVLPRIA